MKKRLIGIALIAVVMMVMFAACSDETVIVSPTAGKPSDVKARQSADNKFVIITWTAAKDAYDHNVYGQQVGMNTVSEYYDSSYYDTVITNKKKILLDNNPGGPTYIENTDPDAWIAVIPVIAASYAGGNDITSGKTFKFGVQASPSKPNQVESGVAWAAPLDIKAW